MLHKLNYKFKTYDKLKLYIYAKEIYDPSLYPFQHSKLSLPKNRNILIKK